MESGAISRRKTSEIWGAEDSFVLYFSFILFLFSFNFLRRVELVWDFNLYTELETVNCSEVSKWSYFVDDQF